MELEGATAIVTGGGSGLGAASARRLAGAGATVTVWDVDRERGEAEAGRIGCGFEEVDVTDERAVEVALADAEARHGPTRILVNCAGIGPPAKVVDRSGEPLPLPCFARIVSVNLLGTFNVLAKFAGRLVSAPILGEERGVIVNTASVAAFDGQIGQAAYSASKAAVVGMALPIAREFARHRIRVMTIAPGLFRTPLVESLPREAQDSLAQQVPFPDRLGDPSEFAFLVEHVVRNPMLNGEVIRLDGAIRMAPR